MVYVIENLPPAMPGKENDMRKELKAVIAAILALWLFFMGFEIGSYVEKQKISAELGEQRQQLRLGVPGP